jgi:folate-binding protein YgfZ
MNFPASTIIHEWRPACWLRVTGEDAANFLQGQFTNELRGMPEGGAVYGLWLTLKGKVLADSFVVRGDSPSDAATFWVGSYFSPAVVIRERLENHVIADDVVIEDVTAEWAGMALLGEGVEASGLARDAGGDGVVFPGRRGKQASVEWVFPVTRRAKVRARMEGMSEVDAEEMARRRIVAGLPAVPTDIGPGDLPGEGGLEGAAISYTKGCYLGQEVMARLKSMGQVRRRLIRVAGTGEVPEVLPAALFAGDRRVGELRSGVRDGVGNWIGLAMLSLMHVEATVRLALAADAEPTVRLVDAP